MTRAPETKQPPQLLRRTKHREALGDGFHYVFDVGMREPVHVIRYTRTRVVGSAVVRGVSLYSLEPGRYVEMRGYVVRNGEEVIPRPKTMQACTDAVFRLPGGHVRTQTGRSKSKPRRPRGLARDPPRR